MQFKLSHLIGLVTCYSVIFFAARKNIVSAINLHSYLAIACISVIVVVCLKQHGWKWCCLASIGLGCASTVVHEMCCFPFIAERLSSVIWDSVRVDSMLAAFFIILAVNLPWAIIMSFAIANITYAKFITIDQLSKQIDMKLTSPIYFSCGLLLTAPALILVDLMDGRWFADKIALTLIAHIVVVLQLWTWLPQFWKLVDKHQSLESENPDLAARAPQ